MLPSGKYQIARPGQPSRQMTLSEINYGLASGEVMPEDQFWIKGMSRWDRVNNLAGVILPTTPKTRPVAASSSPTGSRPSSTAVELSRPASSSTAVMSSSDTPSFWARAETKPRLAVWSPVMYTLLSVFFTPLIGTVMIAQNHRATEETAWRGISWFWLVVWITFLLAGLGLYFAGISCGRLEYWIYGFIALSVCWFFTCVLPHRNFLHARSFDAAWRIDWGKPAGFGFLAWVIVFTVFLLTR